MMNNKEYQKREAKANLVEWKAVKLLIGNNDLAAEIKIAGMSVGICDNSKLLSAVEHNIEEIEKFLKDEENMWE